LFSVLKKILKEFGTAEIVDIPLRPLLFLACPIILGCAMGSVVASNLADAFFYSVAHFMSRR